MQKSTYSKVASYEGKKGEIKKVVLLYTGGSDTSVILKWIQDEYKAEVVTLTLDIGQKIETLEEIKKKARALGATQAYVIDAKDEFAEEYIAHGIKANANYQQHNYLGAALARPLLAKWAIKVATQEGADAIAHGGQGNDQVGIEGTALALNSDIKIIAPVREWGMGKTEVRAYAKKHKIPLNTTVEESYTHTSNLWGTVSEGEEIGNPTIVPPLEKILRVNKLPIHTPEIPEVVQLEFVKGIPVSLNGKQMKLADLISKLTNIGAIHGVGTNVHVEDNVIGTKTRNVLEAPAAEIIITAHKNLETSVCTRTENEFKATVDQKWASLCQGALWYEPLMNDLCAFIENVNQKVTGRVTIQLSKGGAQVVALETATTIGEKAPSFMTSEGANANASAGFIEYYTLPMKLAQRAERTALLSIGKRANKIKLLPSIKKLQTMGYKLYATYKTHKFLKTNKIEAIAVHKISQLPLKPNLADLLDANRFDLVINIPLEKEVTQTDAKVISEKAIEHNATLLTSVATTQDFIKKLQAAL